MPHVDGSNGAAIYWQALGAGEPLVLIMGLGCSSALWFRLAPRLARRFRVIQLDNRGVGNTCAEADVHAIYDVCSHAEVALSEGEVEDGAVECWLHGSRFDLRTGKPIGLPATEAVPVYETNIDNGDVYVALES